MGEKEKEKEEEEEEEDTRLYHMLFIAYHANGYDGRSTRRRALRMWMLFR